MSLGEFNSCPTNRRLYKSKKHYFTIRTDAHGRSPCPGTTRGIYLHIFKALQPIRVSPVYELPNIAEWPHLSIVRVA